MTPPDFTDDEVALIRSQVERRWAAGEVELVPADVEALLHGPGSPPVSCPAVFWQAGGCSFVVQKVGEGRFRARFFYPDLEQYGTGIDEYRDVAECAMTLLRIQADHQSEREGTLPEAPGGALP